MVVLDDLKELAAVKGPCVTIFQPLRDDFSHVAKSATRLTAAAQRAGALLAEKGFDALAREEFLGPIFKVAGNTDWSGRSGSMVVFRAPDFTKVSFWPDTLDLKVHLGDEFLVLPLLAGVAAQRNFWILALSINRIGLFRGTIKGLSEVELPKDLPRNLADAGGFDQPDHDLESRSAPGAATGQTAAIRSGTSSANETKGRHLHDFFKMIDRAIQPILAGSGDPLILAAVSRELALYREVNSYALLLDQGIHGSPEALGEERFRERLQKAALELVAADSARIAEQTGHEMDKAAGRGLLLTDLAAIQQAAEIGQIEGLFVEINAQGDALVNTAALAVIRNSGTVVCCESGAVPRGIAAILRYRMAEAPGPEATALSIGG